MPTFNRFLRTTLLLTILCVMASCSASCSERRMHGLKPVEVPKEIVVDAA